MNFPERVQKFAGLLPRPYFVWKSLSIQHYEVTHKKKGGEDGYKRVPGANAQGHSPPRVSKHCEAEWAAPGRQQNLGRTGAPENEISELDLCKGLAGWSIGSVRAFGMKGSEFEPQTTHWWDRAGPCVGGNSRNLLIATSDHATSDRLLIIDIDYQNY